MANLYYLKNKKVFLMSFIPSVILIILLIFKYSYPILSEFLELLIPIVAIITTLFIPFITNEIEKNRKEIERYRKELERKEKYQEIYNDLAELCSICIERTSQQKETDVRIFYLSKRIKRFSKELLELNIFYIVDGKSETLVFGDDIKIWLNVDNAEGRVWGARISLAKNDRRYDNKNKLQSEVYSTLEKLRIFNKLEWNEKTLDYFTTNS